MINDIDINEIVVSNKFPFGEQNFRCFTGYKDNKEIRPLCKFFPNMSIYKIYSDKTKRKCSPVPHDRPPSLLIFGFFVGSLISYLEPPFIDI